MKHRWLFLMVGAVLGLAGPAGYADIVVDVKGKTFEGNVTGFDDYCVLMTLKDGKKIVRPIERVERIEAAGVEHLKSAEAAFAAGQDKLALTKYAKIRASSKKPWVQSLVRFREYRTLSRMGRMDEAIQRWVTMLDQPAGRVAALSLSPIVPKALAPEMVLKSISLLEPVLKSHRDHPGVRAVLFGVATHIATKSFDTVGLWMVEEWQRTGTKPTEEAIKRTEARQKSKRKESLGFDYICQHSHATHIVYLIDCSQTMAPHLAQIKKELARSLDRLRATHRFCVIAMHDGKATVVSGPRMIVSVKASRASVLKALDEVKAKGRSDFRAGLEQAWDMFRPSTPDNRLVYVISDGNSLDADSAIKGLPSRALEKPPGKPRHLSINTFQFGTPTPNSRNNMERLADKSGGQYRAISTAPAEATAP